MKYIIAGGRDFSNGGIALKIFDRDFHDVDEIVSGCANGADQIGMSIASIRNIPVKKFPAEWNKYGKSAGFIRNAAMGEYADALIAFWDGKSKGTQHMIRTMIFQNKPYWVYDYNGNLTDKSD